MLQVGKQVECSACAPPNKTFYADCSKLPVKCECVCHKETYFQSWEEVEKEWEKLPPWLKRKIPDMVDFLHLVWLSATDKEFKTQIKSVRNNTIDLCWEAIKDYPKVNQAEYAIKERLNKLKEKE